MCSLCVCVCVYGEIRCAGEIYREGERESIILRGKPRSSHVRPIPRIYFSLSSQHTRRLLDRPNTVIYGRAPQPPLLLSVVSASHLQFLPTHRDLSNPAARSDSEMMNCNLKCSLYCKSQHIRIWSLHIYDYIMKCACKVRTLVRFWAIKGISRTAITGWGR